jgi:hypothetical protein
LTINHIPDEVLLGIFDSYRQAIDRYDQEWTRKYVWFKIAHVCRKWRAVMFASVSRLDLGVFVGPEKPGHINTVLSGPWPIFIDYRGISGDITGSALWRMRTVLMHHHDRVRKISFEGTWANFDKFFKVTNCPFPFLESLAISFKDGYEPKIPDTFLRGPDLSDLHLRHLVLTGSIPLASISGFLLSATSLTNVFLIFDDTAFGPSSETTLLTCLQGMTCLHRLHLMTTLLHPPSLDSPSQPSTTKNIVALSKLTYFFYSGPSVLLDALIAGISASSLRDVNFQFSDMTLPLTVHLPRFINEIEDHYRAIHMAFQGCMFQLSLIQSENIGHCHLRFMLGLGVLYSQEAMVSITGALSAKLITVEELHVILDRIDVNVSEDFILWRGFFQQFPNVKALRTEGGNNDCIAGILFQDHQGSDDVFAALEEIELSNDPSLTDESQRGPELAVIDSFVSARQQAGRPVKLFYS